MNSPRKPLFWIWAILAALVFIAAAVYLGISLGARDAAVALPVFIGIFLLFAVLYFTPVHLWFARPNIGSRLGLVLILLAPTMLLHIWLAFVLDNRAAPIVWLAPFMGMATGSNLRVALGKTPS